MKGFSTAQKLDKLGMRGSNTCELVFEDCEIPADNVLGEVNNGVKGADERPQHRAPGAHRRPAVDAGRLDIALPYVRERKQFNQAIGTFGLMQGKIADMYTALQSSRAFALPGRARLRQRLQEPRGPPPAPAACQRSGGAGRAGSIQTSAATATSTVRHRPDAARRQTVRDRRRHQRIRRMLIGRELFAGNS